MNDSRNRLLALLPQQEFARLAPRLKTVRVGHRESLYWPQDPVRTVYFPEGGVFSITRPLPDGTMVEATSVGSEGFLGIEAYFADDPVAMSQSFLQVPDGDVTSLTVRAFRQELDRRGTLHRVVGRYVEAFVGAVMQSAACNAVHDAYGRCARGLLMAHDRMRLGEFRLSHEALAIMLGASRPTVTLAAIRLQEAGLIAYRHGRVRVLNRAGLESAACVCYALIERHFKRVWRTAA